MAAIDDMRAELADINAETDEIAADIDDLQARVGSGLSDAEAAEVQSALVALKERLQAVASDHEVTPEVRAAREAKKAEKK